MSASGIAAHGDGALARGSASAAMNRPIAATPAAPAAATSSHARLGDAANRQHRHAAAAATIARSPSRPSSALRRRLRRGREHGAGDQIVRAGRLIRLVDAVHRSADQEARPAPAAVPPATGIESPRRWTPSAPQASATSSRSLTTRRVGVPARDGEKVARRAAASRAASRSRSRTWMRSMPAVDGVARLRRRDSGARRRTPRVRADRRRRSVTRQIITCRSIRQVAPAGYPWPLPSCSMSPGSSRPRRQTAREVGEAGEQVDDAEAADRAAHEVVRQEGAQRRPRQREVIVLPERRPPRQHDEQQADLDEEDDVEEAAEQDVNPRPGPWSADRSARRRRGSRPASDCELHADGERARRLAGLAPAPSASS